MCGVVADIPPCTWHEWEEALRLIEEFFPPARLVKGWMMAGFFTARNCASGFERNPNLAYIYVILMTSTTEKGKVVKGAGCTAGRRMT